MIYEEKKIIIIKNKERRRQGLLGTTKRVGYITTFLLYII